jgi:hypothetical protein
MYYQYTFVLVRLARLALLSLEPPGVFVVKGKASFSGAARVVCGRRGKKQAVIPAQGCSRRLCRFFAGIHAGLSIRQGL